MNDDTASPSGVARPRAPGSQGVTSIEAPLIRTAARWKIPREVAVAVMARDLRCIYCGRDFVPAGGERAGLASWEHIVNDVSLTSAENIALCCVGCNASKGVKSLARWLDAPYSLRRRIRQSMAAVAVAALDVEGAGRGHGQ